MIRKFLTAEKTKLLGNSFIERKFNNKPLICMFCRKTFYSKTDKIHDKTLKVIYNNNKHVLVCYWKVKVCQYIKHTWAFK